MSNVHQLVVELANYEQQRRDLENELEGLDQEYKNAFEPTYADIVSTQMDALEAQLDFVYGKIDELEALIDEASEQNYGHYGDDF